MKRIVLLLAMILMILVVGCGKKEKQTDFRIAAWGDMYADILSKEQAEICGQGPDSISVKDVLIDGDECTATYEFDEDYQLIKGSYLVKHLQKFPDDAYSDYAALLSEKYGDAVDSGDFGSMHYTKYRTDRTEITLEVANYEVKIKYEPLITIEKPEKGMGTEWL
ncbi:hypothetical protein [Butyrivibrio sp. VCD2006]|uniref:hypothetical protein n=1 Tax=Butyrivibrio sp. VCD2006 TaxID=1280664 RepID=UPI00041AB9F0|nr:hypothetical protein [Butyrivibrio sp. VCD2006]